MKKYVILDRDGVINYDSEHYIKSPDEWIPIPGSLEAIARLTAADYQVVIATNQAGVGRGYYDEAMLAQIHHKMQTAVQLAGGRIDGIFYCPHHPNDNCLCRKPNPGLLLAIAEQFNLDLKQVPLIGDSLRDIQAAQAVQAPAILVRTGNGEHTSLHHTAELADVITIVSDLSSAVDYLLSSKDDLLCRRYLPKQIDQLF